MKANREGEFIYFISAIESIKKDENLTDEEKETKIAQIKEAIEEIKNEK
jgi:hypothetical protein